MDQPSGRAAKPVNRLPLAIVATIVGIVSVCTCCISFILGAIAIVFATQADTRYRLEDYNGAESSAQVSFVLSTVSLSISVLSLLVYLFLMLLTAVVGADNLPLDISPIVIQRLF